ncbi:hypothetical protein B0H19DRAFT_1381108 [Mycena capillaripes]|nr:hypothetical protein B0H19DRAFT_1381108 [Mycena capillaripes]
MDKALVMDILQELLDDLESCESFATAKSGEFKSATAYFGEIGYSAIAFKVKSLFPAAIIATDYSPFTYDTLTEQLGVSNEEAGDILHNSTPFGLAYHSDVSDRDRCVTYFRNGGEDAAPKTAPLPLPLPSPLLAPHALSPTLAPADSEREPTPLTKRITPPPARTAGPKLTASYCL